MSGFLEGVINTGVSFTNQIGNLVLGKSSNSEGFVTQSDGKAQLNTQDVAGVVNAAAKKLLGANEPFVTQTNGTTQVNTAALAEAGGAIMIYTIVGIVLSILFSYGAARNSYCYNIAIGNTADVAFLFSILCFLFPQFYYPYYALALNPICSAKARNNKGIMGMLGGKK